MPMRPEKYEIFIKICREAGWKCTAQRLAVYDAVCDNFTHPGVDSVWHTVRTTLPTISRESVYRILNEFTDGGIIRRIDHIDSAHYDSQTRPHGHFICEKCGGLQDFELPETEFLQRIKIPGRIHHQELRIVGICKKCEKK